VSRNERHVVRNPTGGWDVKVPAPHGRQLTSTRRLKASTALGGIVQNTGGGEIVIHRPNGLIRDSETVAPGHDPYPPRDRR
jgi:carbamate kinase